MTLLRRCLRAAGRIERVHLCAKADDDFKRNVAARLEAFIASETI